MNIEGTKLELMHLLLQTQRESVLEKIKSVFEEENKDWWDDLSEEEKEEIEIGMKHANNNEFISHKKAMKLFKQ